MKQEKIKGQKLILAIEANTPNEVVIHFSPWKWLKTTKAWPNTGATITNKNNIFLQSIKNITSNTGIKTLKKSNNKQSIPIPLPKYLKAL